MQKCFIEYKSERACHTIKHYGIASWKWLKIASLAV